MSLMRRDVFDSPFTALSRFFNDPFFNQSPLAGLSMDEGTLAVDISEDEQNVVVRASLPGFTKEDVTVHVEDGVLTINAQHTEEKEHKGEKFYRKERRTGSMSRRIALPTAVVESQTKAELKEGVLTLRLPKSTKSAPHRIQIG